MRLQKRPRQRARLTTITKAMPWTPSCTTGDRDHYSESMVIDLGEDRAGRRIELCLLPMEAAELMDKLQRALFDRTRCYRDKPLIDS